MLQGNGSAALAFDCSVFPDAKVEEIECSREAGLEGSIKWARFSIAGGHCQALRRSPICLLAQKLQRSHSELPAPQEELLLFNARDP
jgi:predicted 3-demethylubiquinone-9 3-methyltransferase (glyoxalase superfamily)